MKGTTPEMHRQTQPLTGPRFASNLDSECAANLQESMWYEEHKARHGTRFGGCHVALVSIVAHSPWRAFSCQQPRSGDSPHTRSIRRILTPLPPLPVRAERTQPAGRTSHQGMQQIRATPSLRPGPWSTHQAWEPYRSSLHRRIRGLVDRPCRGRMPDARSVRRVSRQKLLPNARTATPRRMAPGTPASDDCG